jgi:hypothetical protein
MFLTLAAAMVSPVTASRTPTMAQASGTVEKQVMSPAPSDMEFYLSPAGGHIAAIVPRGSRFAVFADGVEEPSVDEVLSNHDGHKIHFSPDNMHHAYIAKQGDAYVAFVDGKDIAHVPVAGTRPGPLQAPQLTPEFTPNSKHTYFLAHVAPKPGGPEGDRFWWDGAPVPSPLPNITGLSISPDGEHYALSVSGADRKTAIVVDGKLWNGPGGGPIFTADGRHLITDAQVVSSLDHQLFVDGKPWVRGPLARPIIPPAGDIAAAIVAQSTPTYRQFVVVGTTRVEASVAQQVKDVYFSPDGKHYAASCSTETGRHFVVIDGKKGLDYEFLLPVKELADVVFSADSAHSMYIAKSGKNSFVVVDGVESDGYPEINLPSFSGDGKRFGFLASSGEIINTPAGATMRRTVVVDGKPVKADGQVLLALAFSPRGGRYAYIAGSNANPLLVVDGTADTKNRCCETLGGPAAPRFVFSDDGSHIAHVAPSRDGASQTIVIDGSVAATMNGYISNMTFTPDARHVLWLRNAGAREGLIIYADGKPAAQIAYTDGAAKLLQSRGAWDMSADGVLTAFVQGADSIQRVRIKPPADTSIETLLGSKR